jgi:phage terminase large subunit
LTEPYLYYPKLPSSARICLDSEDGRHRFSLGNIHCDFCGLGAVIAQGEVLYVPTVKGQEYHLRQEPNVLFYGGRGSAKSTTGRWDAHIKAMMYPGFTYLILRRTYPELQKSHLVHINREMELLGGHFHNTDRIAYYPNGSRGNFSHCANDDDVLKLLSAEFALAIFDELTTFDWEMFLKLAASVRVPVGAGYKAAVRGLTNPLGVSAAEVMQFFVHKDIDPEENPDYNPNDWYAIKANLADNPHLDQQEYLKRFSGLSAHVKKAWVEGEFTDEAALFDFRPKVDGIPYHVIGEMPLVGETPVISYDWTAQRWSQHPAVQVYRAVDFGYFPDPSVCLWIAHLGNRYVVFKELVAHKKVASEFARMIVEESNGLRVGMTYCDPSMSIHTGADVKTIKDIFEDNGVPMENSVNNRIFYAHAIHTALAEEAAPGIPRLQIVQSSCPYLTKTLPIMRFDTRPNHQLAMANHKHDHAAVALAYFLISHASDERRPLSTTSTPRWMRPKGNSDRWVLGRGASHKPRS